MINNLQTRKLQIKELEPNNGQVEGLPKNPRFIKDLKFKALIRSLKESPEMLSLRELIVYPHKEVFVIIAGNMRYMAAKELNMTNLPCKILPKDTSIKKLREYAIKDNNLYGEDDWDILTNEWDENELRNWDIDIESTIGRSSKIEEKEIIPFQKTHVLLSFSPDRMIDIQNWLQKIKQIPGVEYEQSSN